MDDIFDLFPVVYVLKIIFAVRYNYCDYQAGLYAVYCIYGLDISIDYAVNGPV
jgi:hypothetical protein